jgi:hypothetical protein|eukprot:COSAG02_NODE_1106_length_14542_cov_4.759468_3_plen_242_part_00
MHFFKTHGEATSNGSLAAVEKTICHYRKKWRGQDWRQKMYQAVASKYGGADPRVLWLDRHDPSHDPSKRLQDLRVSPASSSAEKPPSHLSHLLPEMRQEQVHRGSQGTMHGGAIAEQTGSSRRDPYQLAAAAAIDRFIARQEQMVAAQGARMRDAQAYLAECVRSSKLQEQRHTAAVQKATQATEATESNPPKMSKAERRYVDDDVAVAEVALTEAKAREAVASQRLELARAANDLIAYVT